MGAAGVIVQQWPDTQFPNRSNVEFHYAAALGVVAEAAAALDHFLGTAYTPTNASSYTVPANKRLRLNTVTAQSSHTAANTFTFIIRLTTALTGNKIDQIDARLSAAGTVIIPRSMPDGLEFPAGTVLQFSRVNTVGGAHDVWLAGFLYDVQS